MIQKLIEYSNDMNDIYKNAKKIMQIKKEKYSSNLMIRLLIRLVIKNLMQ